MKTNFNRGSGRILAKFDTRFGQSDGTVLPVQTVGHRTLDLLEEDEREQDLVYLAFCESNRVNGIGLGQL